MPRCNGKLKECRLKAKLSQNKLARVAELDRGTISRAEAGDEVNDVTLAKLVDALNEHLPRQITAKDLLV